MIPNTSFNVSSVQVSQLPLQISQIEGIGRSDIAAGTYLQLHDSCVAPAVGTIPLWELPVSASTQFQETLQIARANCTEGIFLGLSTTAGTYTAAATHMDITVWTDQKVLTTNAVGDKTTVQNTLAVWDQAVSTKKLYQAIVNNATGANCMAVIFAENDAVNGGGPGLPVSWFQVPANTIVKTTYATNGGIQPVTKKLPSTLYTGCKIVIVTLASFQDNTYSGVAFVQPVGNTYILAITN